MKRLLARLALRHRNRQNEFIRPPAAANGGYIYADDLEGPEEGGDDSKPKRD